MSNNEVAQDSYAEEEETLFVQGPSTMANSQVVQADRTVAPAVAGVVGHVLTNGQFQCTRMDRRGNPPNQVCGSIMNNKANNIKSHLNKLHNSESNYATSQASHAKARGHAQLTCDRPRLDGEGWCTISRWGRHSLVAHAHGEHRFKGSSQSLSTPWEDLTDRQRAYYQERVDLEKRRKENGGVYTPVDEALNKRFEKEKFPNA
ncbi:hypothetical protein F4803DRAFT_547315 [Xylaria telfairii]|nr:hypothetical protein F4803DRAFT_547315 [Xylaria telfairii]